MRLGICEASFANLVLVEGDEFRLGAMHGAPEAFAEQLHRDPKVPRATPVGRVIETKQTVHIVDIQSDEAFSNTRLAKQAGARTTLGVPMLKENELIGVILIYRQEVRPFTDKQIELVSNFAAQAVIAIENTRLLKELRQRTDDLSKSLEQQTATAEILQVINRSPGDLTPVFDAMVGSAMRFCQADYGHVYSYEGALFHLVAAHGEARYLDWIRQSGPRTPENSLTLERIVAGAPLVHIADIAEDTGYRRDNPRARTIVDQFGIHTLLTVALRKESVLLGTFVLYRQQPKPFSDKQIALVQNFAAQAVIAIENTRLLNELRQRTDDLSESLEQQTATSEVLGVISSSPGELEPVFDAMLDNATRICGAKYGTLFRYDGELLHRVASTGTPPELVEFQRQRGPFNPENRNDVLGRMFREKVVAQVLDAQLDPTPMPSAKYGGARSVVAVPMLKDNELVGAIVIYRQEVRPFSDKQIDLVKNFAAQAVIAIENTRLLNELRQRTDDLSESLEQQTATSEVLKVISSSPGELEPVFDAMLENATRICEAKFGSFVPVRRR